MTSTPNALPLHIASELNDIDPLSAQRTAFVPTTARPQLNQLMFLTSSPNCSIPIIIFLNRKPRLQSGDCIV